MECTFRLSINDEVLPAEGDFKRLPVTIYLTSEGIVGFEMHREDTFDGAIKLDVDYLELPAWASENA